MKRVNVITVVPLVIGLTVVGCAQQPSGQDSERLLAIDHYVSVRSSIPEISGQNTRIYVRERVQHLYDDIGSSHKVFVQLACSSHNAMWEMNRMLLFRASLEWLSTGSVNGTQAGMLRLGY